MKRILVFGIKRSGIHILIDWIFYLNGGGILSNSLPIRFRTLRTTCYYGDKRDLHILGFEDSQRHEDTVREAYCEIKRRQEWGKETIPITIIRDFWNMSASRIKLSERRNTVMPHGWHSYVPRLWKLAAKEFLSARGKMVWVLYNLFVENASYRQGIAYSLGLKHRDDHKVMASVPNYGGGSSFDGIRKKGDEMTVNQRWMTMMYSPTFRELLKDEEARNLNYEIFGWSINEDGNAYFARDRRPL